MYHRARPAGANLQGWEAADLRLAANRPTMPLATSPRNRRMRPRLDGNHQSANALSVTLRIFLSSPGDVAEECQLARDAIAELQREPQFQQVKLEPVSWDDPQGRTPLVAQLDPQTAVERGIPKPSECDVVVGIFWARMGSPLPADK